MEMEVYFWTNERNRKKPRKKELICDVGGLQDIFWHEYWKLCCRKINSGNFVKCCSQRGSSL